MIVSRERERERERVGRGRENVQCGKHRLIIEMRSRGRV